MKVYVPTLIESVEQAEKLPEGGFIISSRADGTVVDFNPTPVRWYGAFPPYPDCTVTALVPVEPDSAAAVARVLALHAPDEHGACPECTRGRIYPVPAPCATAAALAGDGA